MNYYKLGTLPLEVVNFFKEELLKRKDPFLPYQWIHFDEYLHEEFLKIFTNADLKIQRSNSNTKIIQKAFYSDPGHGFKIHKDGSKCKSALNIALSCNKDDWVRWYDDDHINKINSKLKLTNNLFRNYGTSRNTDIDDYESVQFTDALHTEIGDVYVLNVDKFHSFKCIGNEPRIILQTKFQGFPDVETIFTSLKENSFNCIQK